MRLAAGSAVIIVLSLSACQGRLGQSGLAGTYHPVEAGQESLANPRLNKGQILEIRGDGTFLIRAFPKMEGSVKVDGDLVTLTIEKSDGRPISSLKIGAGNAPAKVAPLRLRIKDGGSRLVPDAKNQGPLKFTWARSPR